MSYLEPYYSRPWLTKARKRFAFTWNLTILDLDLQRQGKGSLLLGTLLFSALTYKDKGEVHFYLEPYRSRPGLLASLCIPRVVM